MIDDTTHLLWVEDWLEVNVVLNSGDVKRDNYSLMYQVVVTHITSRVLN